MGAPNMGIHTGLSNGNRGGGTTQPWRHGALQLNGLLHLRLNRLFVADPWLISGFPIGASRGKMMDNEKVQRVFLLVKLSNLLAIHTYCQLLLTCSNHG